MATITKLSDLDLNGSYNYADYLTWRFEETVELIKGKIFPMSPAPNVKHQQISFRMSGKFYNYFRNQPCRVFCAPFDVRLLDKKKSEKGDKNIYTVVQPDLCVICDKSKLDEQGCIGSPDLIVEILSKGNSKKEMRIKYDLYEETGVGEYWVVFPYEQVLQQFILEKGKYQLKGSFAEDDIFKAHLFSDLEIDLAEIFRE
jgi:Uma2 family endonuclease